MVSHTASGLGLDTWHIEKKEFYLSSIRIYKDAHRVSGLEVKFEATGVAGMAGYEPISHLYGSSSLTSEYQEFDISK